VRCIAIGLAVLGLIVGAPTAADRGPRASDRGQPALDAPFWGAAGGPDGASFATYAAPLHRSEYLVDEAYHLRYYAPQSPLVLTTDTAGDVGLTFLRGGQIVHATGDYAERPRLTKSLASAATLEFKPFADVDAHALVAVWSSRVVTLSVRLTNRSDRPVGLALLAWHRTSGDTPTRFSLDGSGLAFQHEEPRDNWSESPPPAYVNRFDNRLVGSVRPDAFGAFVGGEAALLKEARGDTLSGDLTQAAPVAALRYSIALAPRGASELRVVRAVSPVGAPPAQAPAALAAQALGLMDQDVIADARRAYAHAMPSPSADPRRRSAYEHALNLARKSMLPPEGRTKFNYYVFSREPTWSWGHDGQVFHESLSMLAYAYFDLRSAMDSQRVFIEAQEPDGYIPYRIGSYVVRTFPVRGEKTSSAPFFAWTNWEIYRAARDPRVVVRSGVSADEARAFLRESYDAGAKFVNFWIARRDADKDGLLEWGGHAVLECVRDSMVPIWDALGKDDPSAPSLVEALDLNAMVVREMRALSDSARELGLARDADEWSRRADALAARINASMWDPETRFYYNVDRATNTFTVKTPNGVLDLRRMEIIGFLPLWAGIAPPDRARALVAHLTNPGKFWRRYGVPTLAADDEGYEPLVKRCCQWNGAVWLEWNYLVFDGLRHAGFEQEARALGEKMIDAAITQLERNHRFWESYSPDHVLLESPRNYIWDSLLARVVVEMEGM
jgi:hypothetical protein